ncbi:MAG: phenylphosphate carboxylase subunit delta [Betaproteobacteria bacterium]|nr:phenylphosphate carboxylase subunit delta [Betaproteobacteria bacterium]MBI2959950.1 phenylphosphate carboxylase subunit delta [Betaproteobacteria bacterium]
MSRDAEERARGLKLMAFDVDGVLTDGTLFLADSGEEMKGFNVRDGHGMKMLRASGVAVAIITARRSRVVELRARELGIELLRQGVEDKAAALAEIAAGLDLAESAAGYMGDDLADLPVLARCGFAASVPEAPDAVRSRAHYVARAGGGRGAVREVCEFVLRAQGTLERAIESFLAGGGW